MMNMSGGTFLHNKMVRQIFVIMSNYKFVFYEKACRSSESTNPDKDGLEIANHLVILKSDKYFSFGY